MSFIPYPNQWPWPPIPTSLPMQHLPQPTASNFVNMTVAPPPGMWPTVPTQVTNFYGHPLPQYPPHFALPGAWPPQLPNRGNPQPLNTQPLGGYVNQQMMWGQRLIQFPVDALCPCGCNMPTMPMAYCGTAPALRRRQRPNSLPDDILADVFEFFGRPELERLEMVGRRFRDLIRGQFANHPPETRREFHRLSVYISLDRNTHCCLFTYLKCNGGDSFQEEAQMDGPIEQFATFLRRPTLRKDVPIRFRIINDLDYEEDDWDDNYQDVVPHKNYPLTPDCRRIFRELQSVWDASCAPSLFLNCAKGSETDDIRNYLNFTLDCYRIPNPPPEGTDVVSRRSDLLLTLGSRRHNASYLPELFAELNLQTDRLTRGLKLILEMNHYDAKFRDTVLSLLANCQRNGSDVRVVFKVDLMTSSIRADFEEFLVKTQQEFPQFHYDMSADERDIYRIALEIRRND